MKAQSSVPLLLLLLQLLTMLNIRSAPLQEESEVTQIPTYSKISTAKLAKQSNETMSADEPRDKPTAEEPIADERKEMGEAKKARRKKKNRRLKLKDRQEEKTLCEPTSPKELMKMLGPAFNGRYMSVEKPLEEAPRVPEQAGEMVGDSIGPTAAQVLPFRVDPDYKRQLPTDFYTDISWYRQQKGNLTETISRFLRRIRSVPNEENQLPWQCDSEIIWTDLGANYYPKYLRNVRCTRENCWFGHFKCRPKAFTVNVLKRVTDSCVEGGASSFHEEWVFEERAVTFCCECVEL